MGHRGALLAIVVLSTLAAAAELRIGPSTTVVSSLGPCDRTASRCLAAAGPMVVWLEDFGDQTRLQSLSGTIAEARAIDQPAIATDGQSYLVIWQQGGVTIGAADLRSGNTFTFSTDRTADPPANVVWTGLEYALALPESVVFIRDGAVVNKTAFGDGTAALAAASGNSLLIVRRTAKMVPRLPYPFDEISKRLMPVYASIVFGDTAGRSRELFISEFGHAASVAAGGDGYLLVWKDDRFVHAMRLDQNGHRVSSGEIFDRPAEQGGATDVIATRDGWLVAWDNNGSVLAAELDANGMLIGQVVTVATEARSPSIVRIGEDRFQIFYRRDGSIESRVISASGAQPPRRRAVR
jgi:hypothetical protein